MDMNDRRRSIDGLSPEKRALFERRLMEMSLLTPGEPGIPRRAGAEPCALSFAQQRLWFLDQMEPDSCMYHIVQAVRLQGALQVEALRDALDALVARHEALRSTVVVRDEEPVQVVAERWSVELPVLDLRAVSEPERKAALARALRAEARRPFDLAADLMLRALLVRLGDREHVLLLTMHHIASDGWSMSILTRELSAAYAACSHGRPLPLPPLPIRYADYALWQRQWLAGAELEKQLAYWKNQLAGAPATLQLPTDRLRPAVQTYRGAQESSVLSRGLTDALRALSRQERVTLFMTLLGAFATLLHRYAGETDVVVGTPIAGRGRVETEPLIGFFVNTLVLRADLSGDPSFRECLGRVREMVLGAFDHQDLPFEKLVEELRPERSLSWTPLIQVMFALQNGDQPALDLPGLTVTPVPVDTDTAKFDLTASVTETPQGLRVTLAYNTDLYEPATIRRMLGHYETLLHGIVAEPEQRLSTLPLLTAAERQQLLVEWNATQRAFPESACIPELFAAQVERTPDAVAVTCGTQSLTYRQLNHRANQLAHYLQKRGVGPDVAVGICLKPSLEMIVGLLGILKAGGAYVPLDPTYPPRRLAFMLEDAQAVALLTRQELVKTLPAVKVPIILLDTDPQAAERREDPTPNTTGSALAYLMYTSGSTGQPKAVAVPHRGVTRLVMNTDYVTITAADVMAQASNASFDAATFEIWGALLNGARLVVLPKEVVLSPAEFRDALDRYGVTLLFLTPALFNQMAREVPSTFRKLRTLLVGGEPAEPRWIDIVLVHGAPERLLHVYGPTETTTFACWYLVESVPAGATGLPIGRPIGNTRVYLLDRHLNPVPIGVPGEIHIGGPGVARGYLLRPDLTSHHFIPDRFSAEPGARLYKTGDRARYLADGNIEFLGRMDEQVKIRGHRIEPGEIEAVLRQHPAVREVVVIPREDAPGNKRLVAYVVPAQKPAVGELRGFLKERLPGYMVPDQFTILETLPLTPNGKVDRGKLAAEEAHPERGADYVEPATPLEKQLVQIWEKLLAIRPIGTRDSFFDLGGHSLLAVQLMNAIERAVGRRLPLSTLFAGATIEHLAQALVQQAVETSWSPVTPIRESGSRLPFFFLHGDFDEGGLYCLNVAEVLGPEQPFVALHPHGIDGRAVPASIEAMAIDHLATVRSLQPHGPYLLGGFCNGGLVAVEMARRLQAQGERVALLAVMDASVGDTWFGAAALRGLVERFGAWWGLTPHERLHLYTRVRRGVPELVELGGHCTRRLRDLSGSDLDGWVTVLRRKTRRSREMFARAFRRGRRPAAAPDASPPSPATTGPSGSPSEPLAHTYARVLAGHIPRRYAGTITLLRAGDNSTGKLDGGWRAVASRVDVHVIPGDHETSRTEHVRVLSEHLSACLQKAQQQ